MRTTGMCVRIGSPGPHLDVPKLVILEDWPILLLYGTYLSVALVVFIINTIAYIFVTAYMR